MINRTFVPVGQGCFAIEQIDDFYVVFDCGTITKHNANTALDFLLNRIIEMLPSDSCIRYIFVSHFDEDHVNGLNYLLTKYMVKEVVLPLLSEHQKILQLLCMTTALQSELRNEWIELILHPEEYIVRRQHETKITYIAPIYFNAARQDSYFRLTRPSGKPFHYLDWVFVPFNFMAEERSERLYMKIINDTTIDIKRLTGDPSYLQNKKNIQEVKAAYRMISRDLNRDCMTVYSGSKIDSPRLYNAKILSNGPFDEKLMKSKLATLQAGCLYTGDYDTSTSERWQQLCEAYKYYWMNISFFQIPHHGAQSSFSDEIRKQNFVMVINAGNHNKFHHPNPSVLYSLQSSKKLFFWVNEIDYSKLSIIIY